MGYLYHLPESRSCVIGIEPIEDSSTDHYRLGTIFLRNFYVAFDYDGNKLGFAQNVDLWENATDFAGEYGDTYGEKGGNGLVIFVIIFLLVLTGIAIFIYFRAKRLEAERTVTFEHSTRYKNGVEIRPSEAKAKTAPISSSNADDEQLLDGDHPE